MVQGRESSVSSACVVRKVLVVALQLLAVSTTIRADVRSHRSRSTATSWRAPASTFNRPAAGWRDRIRAMADRLCFFGSPQHHPTDQQQARTDVASNHDVNFEGAAEQTSNGASAVSGAEETGVTVAREFAREKRTEDYRGSISCSKTVLRLSLTGLQLGIAYCVANAVWKAVCEVMDELQSDPKKSGTREDFDLPFVSDHHLLDSSFTALSNSAKHDSVRTLAHRLHASGLPYDDITTATSNSSHTRRTVQSILKSLTRTEGILLVNTLLSPKTDHHLNHHHHRDDTNTSNNELIQKMWNEIGGLHDVKEALLDLVFPMLSLSYYSASIKQQQQPQPQPQQQQYGGLLSNPPGVLLYGPPGCGKTMLVRALAHTISVPFLCITPSTLFRKYVGETNLNVRALFTLAQKLSPCIVFVDELEGLFRERGQEEHEVSRELKTEFMQLWDGIQQSPNQNILVIGATNRPFDVDAAFLRRMPRSLYVGLPDFASRISILKSMLSDVPLKDDHLVEYVAKVTEGYSPSDLKEVLQTAALGPLREARAFMSSQIQQQQQQQHRDESLLGEKLKSWELPPLRSLTLTDVSNALGKVAPTPLSFTYQSALTDYANRASGGRYHASSSVGQHQNTASSINGWSSGSQSNGNSVMAQENSVFFTASVVDTSQQEDGSRNDSGNDELYEEEDDNDDSDPSSSLSSNED